MDASLALIFGFIFGVVVGYGIERTFLAAVTWL